MKRQQFYRDTHEAYCMYQCCTPSTIIISVSEVSALTHTRNIMASGHQSLGQRTKRLHYQHKYPVVPSFVHGSVELQATAIPVLLVRVCRG